MIYYNINSDLKLSTIKEEFNRLFPYLKIEFFKHVHRVNSPSAKADLLESNLSLKHFQRKANGQLLRVTEDMPVAVLEQEFQEKFGVSAQVFRKSGRSWLETSVTDDWTLKRQNDEGKELSGFIRQ